MARHKRVGVIIASLARGGGAERVAAMVADGLQSAGNEVRILTFYATPESYPVGPTVSCLDESAGGSPLRKLVTRARRIAAFCREHRLDSCIVFMEEANFPALMSRVFGCRTPMVVSVRQDPLVYGAIYKQLIRWLYPRSLRVVAVAEKMKLSLERHFGLKNVSVVYNPFELSRITQAVRSPLPKQYEHVFEKTFVFVTVGRLTFQKGHWFLIRAFKKVVEKHPRARLVILGEGDLRPALEKLIVELKLADKVLLAGNQENVFAFLKRSHCFVFPTLWEGFPNTVIEALACDLPVIATDSETGPREILAPGVSIEEPLEYPYRGQYGVLLAPFPKEVRDSSRPIEPDETVLAEVMESFVLDPKLCKQYRQGRERVQKLALPVITKQWEELL